MKNKGFVLALTLFMMTVLLVLAASIQTILNAELVAARLRIQSGKCMDIARAGIMWAMFKLKNNYTWTGPETKNIGEGSFKVRVLSHKTGVGAAWEAESVGTIGNNTRTINCWFQLGSFGDFTYFTDWEDEIWFEDDATLHGRVHTNGEFHIHGHPKFENKVTSANLDSNDIKRNPFDCKQRYKQNDPFYFYKVNGRYQSGDYSRDYPILWNQPGNVRANFAGGQPEIQMPDSTNLVDTAVKVNNLKISGSNDIVFTKGPDDNTNGYINIKGGNISTNLPLVQPGQPGYDKNYKTYQLPRDGLTVYSDSSTSVKGMVQGQATIYAKGQISIPDDIKYHDYDQEQIDVKKDVLGLVTTGTVLITKQGSNVKDTSNIPGSPDYNPKPHFMKNGITLQASIFAKDSIRTEYEKMSGNKGPIHTYGGWIQRSRGIVKSGGNGYDKDYNYDPKLLTQPPPNFPTTGELKIITWKDSSAFGH